MKTHSAINHETLGGATVNASIPKQRTLRFVSPGEEELRAACRILSRMEGICAAAPGLDCITVSYDLHQAPLARIEEVATDAGLVLRGGLHRCRRALWKFAEDNEIANAAHPGDGACCNRPPIRLR